MTAPKNTLRTRRRVARAGEIPADLRAWFEGEQSSPPWSALLPGDIELLPARWRTWKATHPDAVAPAGYESLDKISTDTKGKS